MDDRYDDERDRQTPPERYGGYRREPASYAAHERGLLDRATDEVRSWFGDDEAERRRDVDARRDRERDRRSMTSSPRARAASEDEWGWRTSPYAYGAGSFDWITPGPYTGRGPRGYRRSDERIREDVCEQLSEHGHLDASDIEVTASDGEVTLAGTVDSRRSKRLAEDLADSVSGVSQVNNTLRVVERSGEPTQPYSRWPAEHDARAA